MHQALASWLRERRVELARAWVRTVVRDVERYRALDPGLVPRSVDEQLDAVIEYIDHGERAALRGFAARAARLRVAAGVPIEATLEAFRRGARLLGEAADRLPVDDRADARESVDDAFHLCAIEYGEAYARSRYELIEADRDAWMERWRTLVEGSADAILFLDHEGMIRSWNEGAVRLLGYREAEILGKPFTVLLPDELRESGEMERLERATSSGAVFGYDTVRTDRHGESIPVELSRHVVFDGHGHRIGVTEILRDLRDRWRREASRLQAERLAVVGAMSARLAHEIRNPLSAVVLNLELLADDVDAGGGAGDLVTAVQAEIRRVERVVEEYLQFARMPAPRRERVDVRAIAEDLVLFLGAEAHARGIELVETGQGRGLCVEADSDQLRSALLNLVRNAIEAVGTGGEVRVISRRDRDRVMVEVADNGPGMPAEVRERMFEPFYSTKPQGTGLGLALAGQVVAEHDGTIECETGVGEGTRFTVGLPVAGA